MCLRQSRLLIVRLRYKGPSAHTVDSDLQSIPMSSPFDDLDHQIMEYLIVKVSYRHSFHPNHQRDTMPLEMPYYVVTSLAEAHASINVDHMIQYQAGQKTWISQSDTASPPHDPLIENIYTHWKQDQALHVIDIIACSPAIPNDHPCRAGFRNRDNSDSTIGVVSCREPDEATTIWSEMRKVSSGVKSRVISSSSRKITSFSRRQPSESGISIFEAEQEALNGKTLHIGNKGEERIVATPKVNMSTNHWSFAGWFSPKIS